MPRGRDQFQGMVENHSSPCRASEEGTVLNLSDLQAHYGEQTGL